MLTHFVQTKHLYCFVKTKTKTKQNLYIYIYIYKTFRLGAGVDGYEKLRAHERTTNCILSPRPSVRSFVRCLWSFHRSIIGCWYVCLLFFTFSVCDRRLVRHGFRFETIRSFCILVRSIVSISRSFVRFSCRFSSITRYVHVRRAAAGDEPTIFVSRQSKRIFDSRYKPAVWKRGYYSRSVVSLQFYLIPSPPQQHNRQRRRLSTFDPDSNPASESTRRIDSRAAARRPPHPVLLPNPLLARMRGPMIFGFFFCRTFVSCSFLFSCLFFGCWMRCNC